MGMAAMSDAPEQIWLGRDERYQGEPWIRLTSDFDEECETQEYIRADRIEQLVATNEALSSKLATCEKYRDAYAECDRIGTQAVRDLEVKLAECEARLGKAVEALEDIVKDCEADYPPSHGAIKYFARTTLAELKGESHE